MLLISPENPIAGRNVDFSLKGLSPWGKVKVTFADPVGRHVGWIDENDQFLSDGQGGEASTFTVYADDMGTAKWTRYGVQDEAGTWRVKLDFDNRKDSVTYRLEELELTGLESFILGPHLNGLHGPEAGVFFSDDLPSALAVHVQDRLALASAQMWEAVGEPLGAVPDVYMVGNRLALDLLSQATLVNLGWQGGYYRSFSFKPGIYMLADQLRSRLESVLVHEYIHHVVEEIGDRENLPSWLTEGLAEYYEFELGLERPRPSAFKLRLIRSADNAQSAAVSETLFPLASLESQAVWNNRSDPDQIRLQYDQSHMVIRFMNETFGASSPFDALRELAAGADFEDALLSATGLTEEDFESQFVDWLLRWEDLDRVGASEYFQTLDVLLAQVDNVTNRRAAELQRQLSNDESVPTYTEMLSDLQEVVDAHAKITPPEFLHDIHADAAVFFDLSVNWLGLELESRKTSDSAYQDQANALIPELNARNNRLRRDLVNNKWVLNLSLD